MDIGYSRLFHRIIFFSLGMLLLATPSMAHRPFLVVIDPGHGGSDHGAVYKMGGRPVTEKDLTLKLSQDLARQLRSRGIQVVLTRRQDQDLSLTERTAIANRVGANVFVSIHMNSAPYENGPVPEGIETYILNTSTDKSSKRLADLENSVLNGSVAAFETGSDVGLIVKDLILDANLGPSKRLACLVQGKVAAEKRLDRGVKQALFYVLLGADMPSILIEAGFIHHPSDRNRVLSPTSRRQMAARIAEAIRQFRDGASADQKAGARVAQVASQSCRVN